MLNSENGKGPRKPSVVGDDLGRDLHELLAAARVVERVGRDPDGHAVPLDLLHVVPAGEDDGELDGRVDLRLENVLGPLFGAPEGLARCERHERLGDPDLAAEGVGLPGERRHREPRPDAELPVVVAAGPHQKIAVDLEAKLQRLSHGRRLGQRDDELIEPVVERQDAAALVRHAADLLEALLEVGAGLRVDDRVDVETQGAGRPVLRDERLDDRELRVVSGGGLEAHVDVRQEKARLGRVPWIAPDRLHRHRGEPQIAAEERLVRLARVERREPFRRVIGPVEDVEEIFAASVELRPDEGCVRSIDALDREIVGERRRVDAFELLAVLPEHIGERRPAIR